MKLSAPIFRLKREAKLLSREANIPLNEALDRVAVREGFNSWSLLAARAPANPSASMLFAQLKPGDLVLLGARPGHGKTLLGLELVVEAIKAGHKGVFFTLEYNEKDVLEQLHSIGGSVSLLDDRFELDTSDAISADHIMDRLGSVRPATVVVIDYLQLLDQRRQNPELADQVSALKRFASKKGLIVAFLSQIDRSFDLSTRPLPDIGDVRLPNALDLSLFSKTCFLNDGNVRIDAVN